MRRYYTYILASKSRRLYIGVTNNLERRLFQHVSGESTFTAKYRITRLVYYEVYETPMEAIVREKRLKKLYRREKIALIDQHNPAWDDRAEGWFKTPAGSKRRDVRADPRSLRDRG